MDKDIGIVSNDLNVCTDTPLSLFHSHHVVLTDDDIIEEEEVINR